MLTFVRKDHCEVFRTMSEKKCQKFMLEKSEYFFDLVMFHTCFISSILSDISVVSSIAVKKTIISELTLAEQQDEFDVLKADSSVFFKIFNLIIFENINDKCHCTSHSRLSPLRFLQTIPFSSVIERAFGGRNCTRRESVGNGESGARQRDGSPPCWVQESGLSQGGGGESPPLDLIIQGQLATMRNITFHFRARFSLSNPPMLNIWSFFC